MGKILVVADQGDSCIATSRGLELARQLQHTVEVVGFAYAPLKRISTDKADQATIKEQLLQKRREQLEARIAAFATEGQKVALKIVWLKDIHPWINKRAASTQFDLVIKTSHNSGNIGYTSTDWHLLRECPAPVFIAAENKWHRTKPVLAALDLGTRSRAKRKLNEQVLERAVQLSEALGVELKLISAIEVPVLLADLDIVDPKTYADQQREQMLPQIAALAAKFNLPEKDFQCKRGPVDKVICSTAASTRAQLVVMGTVGRSGIKGRLIGNTAESVLQLLRTDILALKPAA